MVADKKRRMRAADDWSQEQFDAIAEDVPEFVLEVREALRSVMVLGQSQTAAASALGVTRQRVNQMVNVLRARHRPAGWVTASVTVPVEVLQQIRRLELEARTRPQRAARLMLDELRQRFREPPDTLEVPRKTAELGSPKRGIKTR